MKKKRVSEGKVFNWPSNWPLEGQFHPIYEIPERDFLDGALVGAGSPNPYTMTFPQVTLQKILIGFLGSIIETNNVLIPQAQPPPPPHYKLGVHIIWGLLCVMKVIMRTESVGPLWTFHPPKY
jgi:hypothetical protein